MLVLVIPQLERRFLFLIWDFILFLIELLANKLCFWTSQEIQDFLGQCRGEAAGAAQDTGSYMSPTLKMTYHKWMGRFFSHFGFFLYIMLPWWKLKS